MTASRWQITTWMTIGNWSRNLKIGDKIEFDARVTTYMKGYMGRRDDVDAAALLEKDYKLSRPTKIKVLS